MEIPIPIGVDKVILRKIHSNSYLNRFKDLRQRKESP